MKFLERLTQAIKDKNIKKVTAMLEALQTLYDQNDFSLIVRPLDPVKLSPYDQNPKRLAIMALETDIEIFKLLITFFKKNSEKDIYKDTFSDNICFLNYWAIFSFDLPAIKFLINDIGVDLMQPAKWFKVAYPSPLAAARKNSKIFQFLLPLCIAAYESAGKDIFNDLISPADLCVREEIKNIETEISQSGKQQKSNPELDLKLIDLNVELNFIECFTAIYAIFNAEKQKITILYANLGKSFLLDKYFTVKLIGKFLASLVKVYKADEPPDDLNLLAFLNIMMQTLMNMVNDTAIEEEMISLKSIVFEEIIPFYIAIATNFTQLESAIEDVKTYKLILSKHGFLHANFRQDFDPSLDNLKPIKESTPDTKTMTQTTTQDNNTLTSTENTAVDTKILSELSLIYLYDKNDYQLSIALLQSIKHHHKLFVTILIEIFKFLIDQNRKDEMLLILDDIEAVIKKNIPDLYWLPSALSDFILTRGPDSLTIFAIETLGIGARNGDITCIEQLEKIYTKYRHTDQTSIKKALYEQYSIALSDLAIISNLSSETIETLLIRTTMLNPDDSFSIAPKLTEIRNNILKISEFCNEIDLWMQKILEMRNINFSNFFPAAPSFLIFSEKTLEKISHGCGSNMTKILLRSTIELYNSIVTFLKYGKAEVKLNIFIDSENTNIFNLNRLVDIPVLIKLFLDVHQTNLLAKNEMFFELIKIFTDHGFMETTQHLLIEDEQQQSTFSNA